MHRRKVAYGEACAMLNDANGHLSGVIGDML